MKQKESSIKKFLGLWLPNFEEIKETEVIEEKKHTEVENDPEDSKRDKVGLYGHEGPLFPPETFVFPSRTIN